MRYIFACLIFLVLAPKVSANIYINEFSSYQSSGDWIELYADVETDISGWIVKDSTSEIKTISSNTKIGTPSASYLSFTVSNRLNQSEYVIELYQNDGDTMVDSISYGFSDAICVPGDGQTIGRRVDGGLPWVRFSAPTQGTANGGTEAPCPTPTPSPTPTPTPSPDPSPTPTPTPSPSPTLAPSVKPSPKPPAPSVVVDEVGSLPPEGTVAGVSTEIDLSGFGVSPPASPKPSGEGGSSIEPTLNKSRAKTALIVGSGLILVAIAGFFGYRKYLGTIVK